MKCVVSIMMTMMMVVNGFVPGTKPVITKWTYEGDIAPTGYFDPLLISENLDDKMIKYLRCL